MNVRTHDRRAVPNCPFRHDEALAPDPFLTRMRTESPVARARLPYGEGDAWLVTRHDDVRAVTSDRRFSRAALVDRDFPRITPAPIAQREAARFPSLRVAMPTRDVRWNTVSIWRCPLALPVTW